VRQSPLVSSPFGFACTLVELQDVVTQYALRQAAES